jgi:hypothetical protein
MESTDGRGVNEFERQPFVAPLLETPTSQSLYTGPRYFQRKKTRALKSGESLILRGSHSRQNGLFRNEYLIAEEVVGPRDRCLFLTKSN